MKLYRAILSVFSLTLLADSPNIELIESDDGHAWFTGPLIAQYGWVITKGNCYFEPYTYATAITGRFDAEGQVKTTPTFWQVSVQPEMIFGLSNKLDLYVVPTFFYNECLGKSHAELGDLTLGFDYQLYRDVYIKHDWYPDVKLSVYEVFPTGKHDHFSPGGEGTEVGGAGAFSTEIYLVLSKLVHLSGCYYFTPRLQFIYSVPAPVRVKGVNTYGGGLDTQGTVYPAQTFMADFAFEISLSRHWAYAMDAIIQYYGPVRFKGTIGGAEGTLSANLAKEAGYQFTLAPALEYNWNASLGIVFGAWVTLFGQNAPQFFSGITAVSYFY